MKEIVKNKTEDESSLDKEENDVMLGVLVLFIFDICVSAADYFWIRYGMHEVYVTFYKHSSYASYSYHLSIMPLLFIISFCLMAITVLLFISNAKLLQYIMEDKKKVSYKL